MNSDQIKLVQSSFVHVLPIAEDAAALFYARLFELDPALRPMFHGDMQEQGRKLMTLLVVVVRGLTQLDALLPAVQNLGRRHVGYGVTTDHYATVGTALLWTLSQGLGAVFTPAVEEAWTVAYTLLANVMQAAAAEMLESEAVVA